MEDNKLIAEFMGYFNWEDPDYGKYHTSWDWLMPVVEKIEGLGIKFNIVENLIRLTGFYHYAPNSSVKYDWYGGRTSDSKLTSAYIAVVEFIKAINHYNKQSN